MPYAEVAHVRARAGYLGGAWTEESSPSETDVKGFIQDVADEIDAVIAGLGLAAIEADSAPAKALRGLNADGALLLALEATWPAGEGPQEATELQKAVRRRFESAWSALTSGKHAATASAKATDTTAASATSFWEENPDYGSVPRAVDEDTYNPYLDPAIVRGMPI